MSIFNSVLELELTAAPWLLIGLAAYSTDPGDPFRAMAVSQST